MVSVSNLLLWGQGPSLCGKLGLPQNTYLQRLRACPSPTILILGHNIPSSPPFPGLPLSLKELSLCGMLTILNCDIAGPKRMTFSSDGYFFACGTDQREVYLWKESPTGYILHQKLVYGVGDCTHLKLLFPSNAQSIIVASEKTLQLWHTVDSTTFPPSIPIQNHQLINYFILGFSPDKSLVAVAQLRGDTATVLDLKSGLPYLIIETSTKTHGLGVAGRVAVVIGDKQIITWNLPTGDSIPTRVNVNDSIQTTMIYHSESIRRVLWGYARTYCCPTRGIVFGLSRMGMVGMKGVVGGSEGRRGEWGDRS